MNRWGYKKGRAKGSEQPVLAEVSAGPSTPDAPGPESVIPESLQMPKDPQWEALGKTPPRLSFLQAAE